MFERPAGASPQGHKEPVPLPDGESEEVEERETLLVGSQGRCPVIPAVRDLPARARTKRSRRDGPHSSASGASRNAAGRRAGGAAQESPAGAPRGSETSRKTRRGGPPGARTAVERWEATLTLSTKWVFARTTLNQITKQTMDPDNLHEGSAAHSCWRAARRTHAFSFASSASASLSSIIR